MDLNPQRRDWFFPIEEVPVLATVTRNGEALNVAVPHTRQGIHSLKVARPFAGMSALREEFSKTLAGVRSVGITPEQGRMLVRQITGWPQLPEKPKPWEATSRRNSTPIWKIASTATSGNSAKTLTQPSTP